MKFYSCSKSAPDLASGDECSLSSAIFEMEKLAEHGLKKPGACNWLACMPVQKCPQPCLSRELSQS